MYVIYIMSYDPVTSDGLYLVFKTLLMMCYIARYITLCCATSHPYMLYNTCLGVCYITCYTPCFCLVFKPLLLCAYCV